MQKIFTIRENAIGWLVLNNPEKKNAIDYEMWLQFPILIKELNEHSDIRVIIIKGEGGNFSAGADMSQFANLRNTSNTAGKYNNAVEEAYLSLEKSPKPLISMIKGYCLGGGCGLALHTDIRIADNTGKFSIPAAKRGVGYSFAGVKQLVDIVGPASAYDILYTGRLISGQEAYTIGLLTYFIADEDLEIFTSRYAEIISQNAPLTIKAIKIAINECLKPESRQNLTKIDEAVAQCFASKDYQEGYLAFLEKRKAKFSGK